ncbi:hypothetical protein J542_0582 [Acinetobacter baumannii 299505]|nr:hypothetical protein J542_0582 [Acinetobacter baumannii 299505]
MSKKRVRTAESSDAIFLSRNKKATFLGGYVLMFGLLGCSRSSAN